MKDYEIEPGEYDEDANEHGALRAIETQLRSLGVMVATALEEQAEAQRQVADALNRIADVFGGMVQTWRATLPDDSPTGRLNAALADAQKLLNELNENG